MWLLAALALLFHPHATHANLTFDPEGPPDCQVGGVPGYLTNTPDPLAQRCEPDQRIA